MKTYEQGSKKKPPHIRFYCKVCNKLGRQKDFIMPVNNLDGIKGISMACINCLHDKGYRFKGWNYGDENENIRRSKNRVTFKT